MYDVGEMKPTLFWNWVAALLCCSLIASPAIAQTDAGADAGERSEAVAEAGPDADGGGSGGTGGVDADASADELPPEAASDAKRMVRIRKVIELDTQHLRWLRSELRSRTKWFDNLAAAMAELSQERSDKREQLEALEDVADSDATQVEALRAELEELNEDYKLFDTQTDLALTAEKAVKEQIEALEAKLVIEKRALGELTGEIQIEVPEPDAPAAEPTQAAKPGRSLPLPLPLPLPSQPAPAPREAQSSSTMTAAQLHAHKVLMEAEREVQIAKIALSEFVERKQALERQIRFEEGLAETHTKEVENLTHALEAFGARLEKYREAEAPSDKIRRLEDGIRAITSTIKESDDDEETRAAYIESLRERLLRLGEAQLRVTNVVDEKETAADKTRDHIVWLESPIHPQNIAHWAEERGPRMLLVIAAALFLLIFVQLSARGIARALVGRRRGPRSGGTGRADTLAFSFRSASRVVIVVLGVLLVVQEAGVDITTVLGGAAILGVAIAFGAQDMMKDYFSGFLILLEDQYQLGDLVTIRGITGTVESVNMRVTVLRDLEGRVHFIPNGEIDRVTNRTYGWGRPVFEIPVRFDEDLDRVIETLIDVAKGLAQDPDWQGSIIGDPDMLGVDKFTDYGVVIKFMVKTQPDKLFVVRREMLRRIAKRLNELGIQITVPQRMFVRGNTDTEG
jgi:small-conductance mechanosensitive channel